jgi:5-methylcytosine-specific restriction endonuclease McrA
MRSFLIRTTDGMSDWEVRRMWSMRVGSQNARARNMGRPNEVITLQGWLDVLAAHDGKCAHCGSCEYICIDHIAPLTVGGTNTDGNLQPLCAACNGSKGNRDKPNPRWWLTMQPDQKYIDAQKGL